MKNYLITGIAGTGKSTVGEALAREGYKTLETDRAAENKVVFRRRYDVRTGDISTFQRGDGWDELRHVEWKVDPETIRPYLEGPNEDTQFICGYANNWSELANHFDGIFLLEIDADTIKYRLLSRTTGDWGQKHPEELQHAVETANNYNDSIKRLGAVVIDATKPLDDITSQIISLTKES